MGFTVTCKLKRPLCTGYEAAAERPISDVSNSKPFRAVALVHAFMCSENGELNITTAGVHGELLFRVYFVPPQETCQFISLYDIDLEQLLTEGLSFA